MKDQELVQNQVREVETLGCLGNILERTVAKQGRNGN